MHRLGLTLTLPAHLFKPLSPYATDQLTIVFTHISLGDKGKWRCEDANGDRAEKSFELIVYRK